MQTWNLCKQDWLHCNDGLCYFCLSDIVTLYVSDLTDWKRVDDLIGIVFILLHRLDLKSKWMAMFCGFAYVLLKCRTVWGGSRIPDTSHNYILQLALIVFRAFWICSQIPRNVQEFVPLARQGKQTTH